MIAVVTGGTSFIGAALLRRLLKDGTNCYAIVRPGSSRFSALPKDERLNVIRAELKDTETWMSRIPHCDVFYHFAWDGVGAEGRANPDIQRANVNMGITCLKAAKALGAKRFLFSGSQAEYGACEGPVAEDHSCNPVIEYGKGKLRFLHEAEKICQETGIEYVHVRIFSVYGPGDHPWTLVSRCIDSFMKNEEILLSSCTQPWNFVHTDDAGRALALLADCDLKGEHIFNLAGPETRPLKEYVETIRRICGFQGNPGYGKRGGNIEKEYGIEPVIDRLLNVIRWSPQISFEDGIRDLVNQYGG